MVEFDKSKSVKTKKDSSAKKGTSTDQYREVGQPKKLIVSDTTFDMNCHLNNINF